MQPMSENPLYQPLPELQISEHLYKTKIDGLFYYSFSIHRDERGFFAEIAKIHEIETSTGKPFSVKQMNMSVSAQNVVRGLHAEGWSKLVTVVQGKAFCALADVRPQSPTYKQVECFEFTATLEGFAGGLYVPPGIGNSICVLEGPVAYAYSVDKIYSERDPAGDIAVSLFDPELNIPWPMPREQMIISDRDRNCVTLREREQNTQK